MNKRGVLLMVMFFAGMIAGCGGENDDVAYLIRRVGADMKVDGDVNKPAWRLAKPIQIEQNPFNESGEKSPTTAWAVYNDEALFLLFVSKDTHIVATHTELNSWTYKDDCVEFFAAPNPADNMNYFNLEINCVGTPLMHFGPQKRELKPGQSRKKISAQQAARLEIYHSVAGPTKEAQPDDEQWIIEVKIPFKMLEDFTGADRPTSGTLWRVNFYRCGSEVGEINASWQPISLEIGGAFHQPESFAPVRFE